MKFQMLMSWFVLSRRWSWKLILSLTLTLLSLYSNDRFVQLNMAEEGRNSKEEAARLNVAGFIAFLFEKEADEP